MKSILILTLLLLTGSATLAQVTTDSTIGVVIPRDSTQHQLRWGLGVTLGTPAGLNAVVEASSDRQFGRFSGFALPTIAGAQLEYGYFVVQTRRTNIGLSALIATTVGTGHGMLGGTSHMSWSGAGLALSTTLSGFFVQAGLTWGYGSVTTTSRGWFSSQTSTSSSEFTSPQLCAQIGYLYHFGS
jgi:hypothetical protein